MTTHKFSEKSTKQFETLHSDLQKIIAKGVKYCLVDFSLVEGHRSPEKQFEYYKKGRELKNGKWEIVNSKWVITNVDGYKVKGKHNYNPSHAVDFCAYVPNKPELTWDSIHLTYIAATLVYIADQLYEQGVIQHKLRWGGNWDKDGDLADNKLYDRPHVEIYKP